MSSKNAKNMLIHMHQISLNFDFASVSTSTVLDK